jgi:hypothetical protein
MPQECAVTELELGDYKMLCVAFLNQLDMRMIINLSRILPNSDIKKRKFYSLELPVANLSIETLFPRPVHISKLRVGGGHQNSFTKFCIML